MIIEYPLLGTTGTIVAAQTYTSLPIPCRGASCVGWHVATDSDTDASAGYTVQVRKGALGGVAAAPWISLPITSGGVVTLAAAAAALNAGGQSIILNPTGVLSARIANWDEARLLVAGHATNAIDGFRCRAQAIFPDLPGVLEVDMLTTAVVTSA